MTFATIRRAYWHGWCPLKDANGTPVASGVYIIHIDAGDLGETIVKFFGVMPQIDLNAF